MAVSALREKGVGRKGIFFTIMALLIIAFLLTTERVMTTPLTVTLADTGAAQTRTRVMNSYLDTFETQAANSLSTAGYFTLQNLSQTVRKNGAYITDINASVNACITANNASCLNQSTMMNNTLKRLTDIARSNLSIETNYSISKVWVTEEKPFEVVFWMNISYNITDPFANWTVRTKTIRAPVDVTGIEDPAFAFANKSGAVMTRKFVRTTVPRQQFDNRTFYTLHYTKRAYLANPGPNTPGSYEYAPSVLQRYEGKLLNGSRCCGIESVMYWSEINTTITTNASRVNWSFVDYLFFSRDTVTFECTSKNTVRGISKLNASSISAPHHNIRIDNHHILNVYANMSNFSETRC